MLLKLISSVSFHLPVWLTYSSWMRWFTVPPTLPRGPWQLRTESHAGQCKAHVVKTQMPLAPAQELPAPGTGFPASSPGGEDPAGRHLGHCRRKAESTPRASCWPRWRQSEYGKKNNTVRGCTLLGLNPRARNHSKKINHPIRSPFWSVRVQLLLIQKLANKDARALPASRPRPQRGFWSWNRSRANPRALQGLGGGGRRAGASREGVRLGARGPGPDAGLRPRLDRRPPRELERPERGAQLLARGASGPAAPPRPQAAGSARETARGRRPAFWVPRRPRGS